MDTASLVLLFAFGLAATFFGYRVFRVLVVVAGMLFGWFYGPALLETMVAGDAAPGATLVAAIVGAIAAAALAWFAFRILVALFGFAVGWSLGLAALGTVLAALLFAVAAAVLALVVTRPAIIALTALNGAWVTVGTTLAVAGRLERPPPIFFLQPPELPLDRPLWILVVLALAAAGAFVQWRQGDLTVGGPPRRRASAR